MEQRTEAAVRVTDNPAERRFEAEVEGGEAFLEYVREGRTLILAHTEVAPALQGRGIAQALARHAFELARAEKLGVLITCPFVKTYVRRHPEYQDLLLA